MDELFGKLAEILEVDAVKPADVLRDFESWDSLAALSIIAMLDSSYGVRAGAEELKNLKTVGDLAGFIAARRKGGV